MRWKARCIVISTSHQSSRPTGWAALNTCKWGWEKCLHVTFSYSWSFLCQVSHELGVTVVLKGWAQIISFKVQIVSPFPEEQSLPIISSGVGARPISAGLAVLSRRLSQWKVGWPPYWWYSCHFHCLQWGNSAWLRVGDALLISIDSDCSSKQ